MRLDDGVYAALAGSCVELFPEFAREDLKDYWMECIKAWNVNDEAAEGYYQMLTGMVMGAEGSIVDTHRRCCLKGKRRQRRADPPRIAARAGRACLWQWRDSHAEKMRRHHSLLKKEYLVQSLT